MIKSTGIIKYIQKKGPQTTLELFNQFEAKIRKAAPGIEDESRLLAALFNELIIEGDIIKTPDNK
ncbi:MAG: hypothetical protein DRP42_00180 [Tenericutes bacterium]|nr:MAG: hypothetical protein DRP42_00180 [Mycoplasmatota bacterium]